MRFPPAQARRACRGPAGFTLIELLVVLGIVALLLTLAVPRYFPSVDKAKETILADNLRNTRDVIDQFYTDRGRYPDSLEQLVEKKYLRSLPVDPITESAATWILIAPEDATKGALYSIKSGAPGLDRHGKPYSEW
ncbi:type II secretion system protein [Massilia sp. TSP1-1-2]|uniref:type II secretion system protein n=1 Tax=Massilia sp. TSP1-1-2 TaxID=2804649 RepID=UPI003CED2722